jgi:hypothetical protein
MPTNGNAIQGNTINALLGIKPSPMTRILLQEVITWQLDHPESTAEDCQEWLLRRREEGALPIVEEPVKAKKSQAQKAGKDEEERRKKVRKA